MMLVLVGYSVTMLSMWVSILHPVPGIKHDASIGIKSYFKLRILSLG